MGLVLKYLLTIFGSTFFLSNFYFNRWEQLSSTSVYKKAIAAEREAVYFKKPEEALAAIKALEAEFPAKCKC